MENRNPWIQDTSFSGRHTGKVLRKTRNKGRRYENQADRARIRKEIQAGMRDPEFFLDLAGEMKNSRKPSAIGKAQRTYLFGVQKRKLKSELRNTRDLDTFIQKTSHSRTLYALIAMVFFRHVLDSEAYRPDHRYKLAILRAMQEPGLAKAIQSRWDHFQRQFPDQYPDESW